MSSHNGGSGPRSNSYSESKCTNWAEYRPWSLEVEAVHKQFDSRIAKYPVFPKIIEFEPLEGFMRPCTAKEVANQLMNISPEFLKELRAIFILAGTRKQLKSWNGGSAYVGHYWRRCVFLHAYPFERKPNLDWLRRYYVRDVLMHEIGHHLDSLNTTRKAQERFANEFARIHG